MRAKITTTFSSGKIKAMMPTLNNIADSFFDVLSESADAKTCLNFRDYCARFTCDIIGQVAFGLECNYRDSFERTR